MGFQTDVLKVDTVRETACLVDFLCDQVERRYRRDGIIVGLSGGVDSALTAALAVEALGPEKVLGLVLPERESNPSSRDYGERQAEALGMEHRVVDVTPTVEAVCGYGARDEFLKTYIPEYEPGMRYNIALPADLLERDALSFYVLQVELPDGTMRKKRLNREAFRILTSFANIKIRSRMLHLYAEAERCNLLVAGTTNRTEMILGDFCKYGDGGTDIEPLAHLYKNQVYQLADHLEVIPEIIARQPSPDTFSLPVSDQEFFFRISFKHLDLLLYAWEHDVDERTAADVIGLAPEAVHRAYQDFAAKNRATDHLRCMPAFVDVAG